METKYFAYCPDCGTRKEVTKYKNAIRSANAHNKRCPATREQTKPRSRLRNYERNEIQAV